MQAARSQVYSLYLFLRISGISVCNLHAFLRVFRSTCPTCPTAQLAQLAQRPTLPKCQTSSCPHAQLAQLAQLPNLPNLPNCPSCPSAQLQVAHMPPEVRYTVYMSFYVFQGSQCAIYTCFYVFLGPQRPARAPRGPTEAQQRR